MLNSFKRNGDAKPGGLRCPSIISVNRSDEAAVHIGWTRQVHARSLLALYFEQTAPSLLSRFNCIGQVLRMMLAALPVQRLIAPSEHLLKLLDFLHFFAQDFQLVLFDLLFVHIPKSDLHLEHVLVQLGQISHPVRVVLLTLVVLVDALFILLLFY